MRQFSLMFGVAIIILVSGYLIGQRMGTDSVARGGGAAESHAGSTLSAETGFLNTELALGGLPWFDQRAFALPFRNGSASSISVATIQTSCGCTVIESNRYSGRVILPGETIEVAGVLAVEGALGSHRKRIDLLLERGEVYTAFLSYEVFGTYSVVPDLVNFGTVDLDDGEECTRSVVFASDTARISHRGTSDSPWLNVGTHNRADGSCELVFRVSKGLARGDVEYAQVRFETDDPYRPVFTVSARLDGTRRLRAFPSRLFLQPGQTESVSFLTDGGVEPRLTNAVATAGCVDARIDASGSGLTVRLDSNPSDSAANGVSIKVTDDQGHTVQVLVFAVE